MAGAHTAVEEFAQGQVGRGSISAQAAPCLAQIHSHPTRILLGEEHRGRQRPEGITYRPCCCGWV